MIKHKYKNDKIYCTCGNKFSVSLESELISEIDGSTFETEMEDTEEFDCPSCKMRYELTVEVEKVISTLSTVLIPKGRIIEGLSGTDFNLEDFLHMDILDEVPLSDGSYIVGNREFVVKDLKLNEVWSISDSNQASLFEVEVSL